MVTEIKKAGDLKSGFRSYVLLDRPPELLVGDSPEEFPLLLVHQGQRRDLGNITSVGYLGFSDNPFRILTVDAQGDFSLGFRPESPTKIKDFFDHLPGIGDIQVITLEPDYALYGLLSSLE